MKNTRVNALTDKEVTAIIVKAESLRAIAKRSVLYTIANDIAQTRVNSNKERLNQMQTSLMSVKLGLGPLLSDSITELLSQTDLTKRDATSLIFRVLDVTDAAEAVRYLIADGMIEAT